MSETTQVPIIAKSATRAILPLGKYRVVDRTDGSIKIRLSEGASFVVNANMAMFDVKVGDLLTLYTEVLFANAQPS